MITRTILIILVIGIAIKIYNKPPWPKRETEPLPNQIKCNQIEGEEQIENTINEDYRSLSNNSFYLYILIQVLLMLHSSIHTIYDHDRVTLDLKLIGAINVTGGMSDLALFLILTNIHILSSTLIYLAYFAIVIFSSLQNDV